MTRSLFHNSHLHSHETINWIQNIGFYGNTMNNLFRLSLIAVSKEFFPFSTKIYSVFLPIMAWAAVYANGGRRAEVFANKVVVTTKANSTVTAFISFLITYIRLSKSVYRGSKSMSMMCVLLKCL